MILKLKKKAKDRKDFAIKLIKRMPDYKEMGFMLYDDKIKNYEEYLNNLTTKKIIEGIERYENI